MANSIDQLVRDLRKFRDRKEVTKQLRTHIRKPVPAVRKVIKKRALAIMPKRGGLNVWVAATKITAQVKFAGKSAGVKLKGRRSSANNLSDLRRLDAYGRIRHPSWGRRGPGQWHPQEVPKGFFSEPVAETDAWRKAIVDGVDQALEVIRRG